MPDYGSMSRKERAAFEKSNKDTLDRWAKKGLTPSSAVGGVWRTIRGRRVFIKSGQSLKDAMQADPRFAIKPKESGSSHDLRAQFRDAYKALQANRNKLAAVENRISNNKFGAGDAIKDLALNKIRDRLLKENKRLYETENRLRDALARDEEKK